MKIQHMHTEKGGRFYIIEPDETTTELIYRMAGPNKMIIDHTEVSEKHEGKGIGRELVAAAVEYAREHNIKILPICPFAKAIISRVEEFHDVLLNG